MPPLTRLAYTLLVQGFEFMPVCLHSPYLVWRDQVAPMFHPPVNQAANDPS